MSYELTPEADMDLVDVWFYTARHWGKEQADKYVTQLHHDFHRLDVGEAQARPGSALYPEATSDLQIYLSGKHYVIFREKSQRLEILAVLHSARARIIANILKSY